MVSLSQELTSLPQPVMTQSPRFRSSSRLVRHILGTRVLQAPTDPAAPQPPPPPWPPHTPQLPCPHRTQNPNPSHRGARRGFPVRAGDTAGAVGDRALLREAAVPSAGEDFVGTAIPLRVLLSAGNSPVRAGRQKLSGTYSQSCPQAPSSDPGRKSLCRLVEAIPLAATLFHGRK